MINKLKSYHIKKIYKFGIEVSTSVQHTFDLDRVNGNTFWKDKIEKEMKNVNSAFEDFKDNEPLQKD